MMDSRTQLEVATQQATSITPTVIAICNHLGVLPKDLAKAIANVDSNAGYMGILVAELMKVNQEKTKKENKDK